MTSEVGGLAWGLRGIRPHPFLSGALAPRSSSPRGHRTYLRHDVGSFSCASGLAWLHPYVVHEYDHPARHL